MNDHSINIGNIQPCFNDRSGNQYIDLTAYKTIHHPFQFPLAHLSMGKIYPGIRNKLSDPGSYLINICHPIIYIINLSATAQFSFDGFPDSFFIILHHISLDRHTIHRWFFQHTHIPDPDQTHMKGSWNRCGGKCQHIHILLHLLDPLFMCNPEALLLVNDQKTKVFKFYILGKDSVGTYHNIHLSLFQIIQCFLLLGRRAEPTQQIHTYRKFFHPLYKSIVMLLSQDCSRHQIHHLTAFLYSLKSSTQGNLRFSIPYIATYKAIHDLGAFHIFLGIFNGHQLIVRFLIGKHFLKFSLPYSIRSTYVPFFFLPGCIQLHQLFCNILYGSPHLCFGTVPFLCSQLIQLRLPVCICAGVFL